MIAPVLGSGSAPACMIFVANFIGYCFKNRMHFLDDDFSLTQKIIIQILSTQP